MTNGPFTSRAEEFARFQRQEDAKIKRRGVMRKPPRPRRACRHGKVEVVRCDKVPTAWWCKSCGAICVRLDTRGRRVWDKPGSSR